jgi:hypothetical protein
MTANTETGARFGADQADHMSAWWWLWLPLSVLIALGVLDSSLSGLGKTWLYSETGPLEGLQIFLLLASVVMAALILGMQRVRRNLWIFLWVTISGLGALYTAGEEASWGQHFFNWATPEAWQEVNDQRETNLHNTSSWLDQKPRTLLELGVIVGGIVLPLLALGYPALRRWHYAVLLPPLICLPTALLAEATRLTERAVEAVFGNTFLFSRASEVQELFFYFFLLLYLVVLRRRLTEATI